MQQIVSVPSTKNQTVDISAPSCVVLHKGYINSIQILIFSPPGSSTLDHIQLSFCTLAGRDHPAC